MDNHTTFHFSTDTHTHNLDEACYVIKASAWECDGDGKVQKNWENLGFTILPCLRPDEDGLESIEDDVKLLYAPLNDIVEVYGISVSEDEIEVHFHQMPSVAEISLLVSTFREMLIYILTQNHDKYIVI